MLAGTPKMLVESLLEDLFDLLITLCRPATTAREIIIDLRIAGLIESELAGPVAVIVERTPEVLN